MQSRLTQLVFLLGSTLALAIADGDTCAGAETGADADAATSAADASHWKCAQCPFFKGFAGDVAAGVLYEDGANAAYGRYTGIDHGGAYADLDASGQWAGDGGQLTYDFANLGLASRSGAIEMEQQGVYAVQLGYQGQPDRVYDTTTSPYAAAGTSLRLPPAWQAAGTTGGMTQLAAALRPFDIGAERRTASLSADYLPGLQWRIYGEYRHQEKDGHGLTGASSLTDAVQLPAPFSYSTDSFEAGVAWAGRFADARIFYTGSWFKDNDESVSFSNPYLPIVPGATLGRLSSPPGNNLQQLAVSGQLILPLWAATNLTYNASVGRLKQDAAFLPISTLNSATVGAGSLDGNVHLSHYAVALATRPIPKLYLRGNAGYDGRDDHTDPLSVAYVVTDSLPGGTFVTPRYGEDRTHVNGSADYRLFAWARFGVGGDFHHTHYSPGQVVLYSQESRSWIHATLTPIDSLTVTLKGGNARRQVSGIDVAALPAGENPVLSAFEYAPRDREFFNLYGVWQATSALSWAIDGTFANDSYRLSQIGLQNSHDRNVATTLTWAATDTLSVYLNGGYQRLAALQRGESSPEAAMWSAADAQHYWNTGLGGHWAIHEHWDLQAAYSRSTSAVNTNTVAGGAGQAFPENQTTLQSLRLNATYRWTQECRIRFHYGHEKYASNDWALDGVLTDTVPNLLSVGAQPYRYAVNAFGLAVLYQLR